ncbi:MAG: hypothetical protein K2P57_13245 [Burkholderiales bacterium]|nr:hypothetical protein [Burkholderiales bacterium]
MVIDRDLIRYTLNWVVFGAIAGLFAPVASDNSKLQHLIWGLVFGVACGYAFTLLQNTFNMARNRKITWGIAAAIWLGFNFAFAGISI